MGPIANSRLYNMKSLVTSRSATVVSKLPNDQTNGNVNWFINKCVDRLAWLLRPEFSLRRNFRHFWQKKEIRLQGCNLESQIKGTLAPHNEISTRRWAIFRRNFQTQFSDLSFVWNLTSDFIIHKSNLFPGVTCPPLRLFLYLKLDFIWN